MTTWSYSTPICYSIVCECVQCLYLQKSASFAFASIHDYLHATGLPDICFTSNFSLQYSCMPSCPVICIKLKIILEQSSISCRILCTFHKHHLDLILLQRGRKLCFSKFWVRNTVRKQSVGLSSFQTWDSAVSATVLHRLFRSHRKNPQPQKAWLVWLAQEGVSVMLLQTLIYRVCRAVAGGLPEQQINII